MDLLLVEFELVYDLLGVEAVFSHLCGNDSHEALAARQVCRVDYENVIEGFRSFKSRCVSAVLDLAGDGDVDDVIGIGQLLGEEFFGFPDCRALRENDVVGVFHVLEDALCLDLLAVLEKAFFRADLVRDDRDTVLLDELR